MKTNQKGLFQLLGIAFFVQAMTSLIGGGVLFEPLVEKDDILLTMKNIAHHVSTLNVSIILQILTALVIIVLGVALYHSVEHIGKTMAVIALSFYLFEAVLLAISQTFLFELSKVSRLYLVDGDATLVNLADMLLSSHDFTAKMAIVPFGLGAILFYSQLTKAGIIPKWLGFWGVITVSFVLVGIPLMAFGVNVPFALFVPYVPFEFFTGIYILIKYRSGIQAATSY